MTNIYETVESTVCDVIGVSMDEMRSKTKKGACVMARHLSMLILHCNYKISIRNLSLRYCFSVRHTFNAIAQIKYYLSYNEVYQSAHSEILERLTLLYDVENPS